MRYCFAFLLVWATVVAFPWAALAADLHEGKTAPQEPSGEKVKTRADESAPAEPATAAEHIARAQSRYRKRDLKGAEADLAEALKKEPGNSEAQLLLAEVLLTRGQPDKAIALCDQALTADPKNIRALRLKTEGLLQKKDAKAAIALCKKAIALQPDSVDNYLLLGWVHMRSDKPNEKEAESAFRQAIKVNPKSASAHYQLASVLAGAGRKEEALQQYLKACEFKPTWVDAFYNAGQMCYNLGRFAEAHQHWVKTNKLSPEDLNSAKKIIQALYAMEKYDEAKPWRDKLFRLRQESKDPRIRGMKSFCFDQFKVGEIDVLAHETFDKEGLLYYHYVFYCYDRGGKLLQTVNIESSAVIRETGVPYILGANFPDGTHASYGKMWKELPKPGTLRKVVAEVLQEKPAPAAESRKGKTGDAEIKLTPAP